MILSWMLLVTRLLDLPVAEADVVAMETEMSSEMEPASLATCEARVSSAMVSALGVRGVCWILVASSFSAKAQIYHKYCGYKNIPLVSGTYWDIRA